MAARLKIWRDEAAKDAGSTAASSIAFEGPAQGELAGHATRTLDRLLAARQDVARSARRDAVVSIRSSSSRRDRRTGMGGGLFDTAHPHAGARARSSDRPSSSGR